MNQGNGFKQNVDNIDTGRKGTAKLYNQFDFIEFPMTCCLCSNTFLTKYTFDANTNTFDLKYIGSDIDIDSCNNRGISAPSFRTYVEVYDLNEMNITGILYELDLSKGNEMNINILVSCGLVLILNVFIVIVSF